MADIRSKHELLRDECQRRADEAWQRHLRKDISETERQDALDQYHALVVFERNHARTVTAAADVYPVKFTKKNAGPQSKTAERIEFVQSVVADCIDAKRQALALKVWAHPNATQFFNTYESVYRFLGRPEFF